MNIAAPIVANDIRLVRDLVKWTRSKNRWRRRFAVACSAALNQKGRSFAEETLQVCAALLADEDVSVQRAVGWALREACKSDEDAVFALLMSSKGSIHPKILREGAEKLSIGQRARLEA